MAKRTKRRTRIASVALLGTTVFANPAPAADKKPSGAVMNRPGPDRKRVDAGTPPKDLPPPPDLIINTLPVGTEQPVLLPDGGSQTSKK